MGTFENPVWTASEVGGLYLFGIIFFIWVAYQTVIAGRDAVLDIRNMLKKWKSSHK